MGLRTKYDLLVRKHRINLLTHHKCASTWLLGLVDRVARQNSLKYVSLHHGSALPSRRHHISLLINAIYPTIAPHLDVPSIHIIRNPLSIISSAYFSHRKTHPTDGWEVLEKQRTLLQSVDKTTGMLLTLAFLESAEFYPDTPGPLHGLRSWNFDDPRITTVRMEDMVKDIPGFLKLLGERLGDDLTLPAADEFSFEAIAGHRVGEVNESSHYRSGDAEGWRAELPPAVVEYVWAQFTPLMERYYPESRPA
ncbi:sulfotransferase domain-containing protein [Starkeya koreensis]|uniref:Sulfotransferase domain-containing protein n=1 Tax=Ancylobacter koreensis TaxID=266121 RepID=A0ABT0DHN2_9HYPH|nr:sulfotransferase domain-containing protein [Ancylobacter koreensis]MCK0206796.1 sulfotransferase domain-containing protein [Ancylobacter koreensis]